VAIAELQMVLALRPEDAFAALADIRRRPALDPTISEVMAPAGPPAIGATFSGRGSVTGADASFEGMITGLDAPRLVAFGMTFFNGARLFEEWRLSATASGSLVRYTAELRLPGGIGGRLLDRILVGRGFRKQREDVLARIKATLDAQA